MPLSDKRAFASTASSGGKSIPWKQSRAALNPLQKITYLALLNILLPFQIITGVLMGGAERWPQLLDKVGGLWVLGPAHTLGAYLFVAFLTGHLYLSTTGTTPWSLLRAMITGYEKL